ncbi:MAG TPA: hypothetical protein DCM64_11370 [Gammaproteobacteria bacterium]|nr:hypothetical protein [Gammaproteobacteria bacterium]
MEFQLLRVGMMQKSQMFTPELSKEFQCYIDITRNTRNRASTVCSVGGLLYGDLKLSRSKLIRTADP